MSRNQKKSRMKPSSDKASTELSDPIGFFSWVMYPKFYTWFLLFASLDILLTGVVLFVGGDELNAFALYIFAYGGLPGLTAFKYANVLMIVLICEWIGRRRIQIGRKLIILATVISVVPVAASLYALYTYMPI